MLKKKTILLLKMTEKDSRHVFKKRSCNNIFIMKNKMYVLGTTSSILGTWFKTILQPIYTIAVTAAL